ncbi:hypothetical protein CRYUN_Cryun10bG0064100 [Craigia yunnanensis]
MENGQKQWRFQGNKELNPASAISLRGVIDLVIGNLSTDDPRPTIPLGNGDPSQFACFKTSTIAEDAIVDALHSAKYNGYEPTVGVLSARRAIADYLNRDLTYKLSADDIYLTSGCTQAIEVALAVIGRPGANILLPRPGFTFYESRAGYGHLQVRHFNLLPDKGWEADLDAVEALVNDNTVAMVIINPGNPCGSVYSSDHLKRHSLCAIGSIGSIVPVLTLGSKSKRWLVPGWRLDWLVTTDPNGIFKKSRIVESITGYLNISTDPATFIQGAVPQILENTKDDFFSKMIVTLREAADKCYDGIKEVPCLTIPKKPEGSMFVMLAKEESVIIVPAGMAFGMKNWLQITFACEISALEEGLRRIKALYQRHVKKA